jgi:hypothetical protein
MTRGLFAVLGVLCVVGFAAADVGLKGESGKPFTGPEIRPETIYQGDLIPEMGLGCSNSPGTSGGPNDVGVGVQAFTTPPFSITSHWYNVYTQVSPTINSLSFVVWSWAGGPPLTEIGRQAGMNWAMGNHTAAINPCIPLTSDVFAFGQNQPQSNVGMRWGLDTSSSAMTSYIRAPGCGATSWIMLDQLGFPGNWVMSVTVDDGVTPAELQSWGAIKAVFK